VSDTHGLLEPRLAELFAGSHLILHAGDIVGPAILAELGRIAPVRAVRGNNDLGPGYDHLPEVAQVELGALAALVVHQIGSPQALLPGVRRLLARQQPQIVVYGHSHRPAAAVEGGRLFVNPGSSGPRRFTLPRAAGLLEVRGREARVRLFDLARPELPLLAPPLEVTL
jgi:putative phosphoesterase